MTLDELDRLAAEKVMGGIDKSIKDDIPPAPAVSFWVNAWGQVMRGSVNWQPTRNISQAFECLEKMEGSYNVTWNHLHRKWYCSLWDKSHVAECDTASEAIVRACLRAKGVKV